MREFLFVMGVFVLRKVCPTGSPFVKAEYSKAFGVATWNNILDRRVFMLYTTQAVFMITQVVVVELSITVASMTRPVITGATQGGTDASLVVIPTGFLFTHYVG